MIWPAKKIQQEKTGSSEKTTIVLKNLLIWCKAVFGITSTLTITSTPQAIEQEFKTYERCELAEESRRKRDFIRDKAGDWACVKRS